MEDPQPHLFTENFTHSCCGSAGHSCLAGSIVAMVPEIYDSFLEKMVDAARSVKTGDAMDPDVYMGPLISAKARKKVENYIETGIKEGANLVLDGRNPEMPEKNKNGYFIRPTIFEGVTPSHTIAREEIFGPVVSVMKVRDLDDALDIIRAQPFGNGACIFTQNQYYAETFIAEADVGMIGVNVGISAPHPYLPFGGIKDSHLGTDKAQGKDGIDFFTQNKIATIRVTPPPGHSAGGGDKTREPEKKEEGPPAERSCVAR